MTQSVRTLFLMADPDFLFGCARVGDLFGQFDQFNFSRTPREADARALASDWIIIGDGLVEAMADYRRHIEVYGAEPSRDQDTLEQLELSFHKK